MRWRQRFDVYCRRSGAQALGLRVELLPQDLSHGDINKQLGRPGAYTEAVEVFLRSVGGLH